MKIEKTITLCLDTEETYLLRSLASMADCEMNHAIKTDTEIPGYSWSDLKKLREFATYLKDL
jgi:hypothetical protein